ncbi:unnamed protein product [Linum tenue]|uniref:Ubiquitin-like protease family profile domain-containing protein n=1 Tax=Linum tenue TaxID=586396 RepID=A0AAV0N561_9ROSI|nr:unnamed protein product [Linum tenue]
MALPKLLCFCCSLDKRTPESNGSNEINQMSKLYSLMEELKVNQLALKNDMEQNISELRRSLDSLTDWLMEKFATIRPGDPCESGMKHNKDKGVEVINISTDSSCSLSRTTAPKMTDKAASARKKGKVGVKPPVKVRSPILTRRYNEMRNKRIYSIGPFTTSSRACPMDLILITHVFDQSKDECEELVRSPWFNLNRAQFKGLAPDLMLSSQVITMCVDFLTLEEFRKEKRVRWFLPPAFSMSVRGYSEENIRRVYCSEDFNDCEKIFVPILLDNHFFLSVFDLKKEVKQIWDSYPNFLDPGRREEKLSQVAKALDSLVMVKIIKKLEVNLLESFTTEIVVNAPRQKNGVDCGLFVTKLMRNSGCLDDCARKMKKKFESQDERLDLALYLLNNKENEIKDVLHRKVVMESGEDIDEVEGTAERSETPKKDGNFTTYKL